jgi:hypothetical protein
MNLVLTLAIGNEYSTIAKATHPSLRAYAKRIGADFKVIDRPAIAKTTPHWEKFQIAKLLDTYERIAYIDTDSCGALGENGVLFPATTSSPVPVVGSHSFTGIELPYFLNAGAAIFDLAPIEAPTTGLAKMRIRGYFM